MKIKSLLSLIVCGVASQLMVGCASSGQYFDFSTPALSHQKAAPAAVTTIAPAEPTTETSPLAESEAASLPLEASAATPVASARAARTAPLTTSNVSSALAAERAVTESANNLASATTKKDMKTYAKKLKRDVKAAKKANALNHYAKMGILLIVIGLVLTIFGGIIAAIGGIVALVGVIVLVLGILEMI